MEEAEIGTEYARGFEDACELIEATVAELSAAKLPVEKLKNRITLEVQYLHEKAREKKLRNVVQALEG